MRPFQATLDEARELGTDPDRGLTDAQASSSREKHGDNRLPEIKGRSVWSMFLGALNDKTIIVLIGAALVAIGVEFALGRLDGHTPNYLDGIAIWVAVAIATLVTTLNEARAAKEFKSLAREREDIPVTVLRGGRVGERSIYDLVVGDIVFIESGDRVPADGSLLKGVDVAVDQSMLTGESESVQKREADRGLLAGSIVTNGSGSFLVTAVGVSTEAGKLQVKLSEDEDEDTPLQERLGILADRIGLFGLGAAILTFLALTGAAYFGGRLALEVPLELASQLLQFLIIGVTIVVVAVPEGLPVAVTISLAYSVGKMARDRSLVRHLQACETMGAATVVCSDKTGTLTENRMSVTRLWFDGASVEPEDAPPEMRVPLSQIASVNSTAFLEHDDGRIRYVGNPTEGALLAQVEAWGDDWKQAREDAELAHQYGFTSDRKRMSTVVRDGGEHRVLMKGAPEVVVARCARILTSSGERPMTESDLEAATTAVEEISRSGRRTLGFAVRALAGPVEDLEPEAGETEMTLVGFAGISDPVRAEVKAAITAARHAGVEVKMVTGDNRHIAEAIGRELSLLEDADLVMEGPEFREKSDEELRGLLPRVRLLARSVPTDKHRLVTLLQSMGEVVAVTGDGTNDAPALKRADVGFSMGITGTEVAKEASDIVILDDNFASIVRAIRWGRSIFGNIRKFLQFQLTVNVAALLTAFLAAVFGFGIPLNTVQLLWVNLIMDTLAALALAVEPPTDKLLEQPPHGRHAPLITRSMWTSIVVTGVLMVAVLMGIMWGDWFVPEGVSQAEKYTFVFNAFVMMQLFNEVNARSTRFDRSVLDGLLGSYFFLAVLVLTLGLQVLIIQFGGEFFKTVPLGLGLWARSLLIGASFLVFGAGLRAVGRSLPENWFKDREALQRAAG